MSKKLNSQLRHIQTVLYQKELDAALQDLFEQFQEWKNGEKSGFELSDEIHLFYRGIKKELYLKYERPSFAEINLASALANGLISKDEITEELYEWIEPKIQHFKDD